MESKYSNLLEHVHLSIKSSSVKPGLRLTLNYQNACNTLSTRQTEVINLLFYEKFSYEAAVRIMDINLRSVYTLTWNALAILRKELCCFLLAFLETVLII